MLLNHYYISKRTTVTKKFEPRHILPEVKSADYEIAEKITWVL